MADEKNLNEEEDQEMTVTLTLDDDTEVECVVLTIFKAGEREYIALLPMEAQIRRKGRFISIVTARARTARLPWTTSRTTTSTRSWPRHSTSCWTSRSTTSW